MRERGTDREREGKRERKRERGVKERERDHHHHQRRSQRLDQRVAQQKSFIQLGGNRQRSVPRAPCRPASPLTAAAARSFPICGPLTMGCVANSSGTEVLLQLEALRSAAQLSQLFLLSERKKVRLGSLPQRMRARVCVCAPRRCQ